MRMTGEQRISATRQRVWEALNDTGVLRQCIPGCQSLDREADGRLRGIVEIRIGPIGARFAGIVTLSELDPPNAYTITGEGQAGTVGSAKGSARVRLADEAGATRLSYEVDAQVGGRLAQLGGPLIDATAKQLAARFFARFGEIVAGPAQAAPVPEFATATAYSATGSAGRFPVSWVLGLAVAALAGFLVGRHQGGGSDWQGLAIGLLLLVVAASGFEYGRRSAAPVLVLDQALLARLAGETRR